jgi:hypothetical protein
MPTDAGGVADELAGRSERFSFWQPTMMKGTAPTKNHLQGVVKPLVRAMS